MSLGLRRFCGSVFDIGASLLNRNGVTNILPITYQQQRGKKKKSGGVSRNRRTKTKNKAFGPLRSDGQFVYQGETLVLQRRLMYYPGENVGIQKNNMLYALRDGLVIVSCEKLNPYPDSPLYKPVNEYGHRIYKKFINVYPTPVHAKFKLIE